MLVGRGFFFPQPWHGDCHFLDHWVQPVIIQKRSCHVPPQLHIGFLRVGHSIRGATEDVAVEGNLQCVAVGGVVQQPTEEATASSCFHGIPVEGCAGVGEVLGILAEELGEDGLPLEALLILKDVAVHEAVCHGGVGVDVDIKLQARFWVVVHLDDELLHPMQGRVGPRRGIQPVTVQVKPHQRAPVIAQVDAIRIEHGCNLEDEVFPQDASNRVLAYEEVDDPLTHK